MASAWVADAHRRAPAPGNHRRFRFGAEAQRRDNLFRCGRRTDKRRRHAVDDVGRQRALFSYNRSGAKFRSQPLSQLIDG